MSVNRKKFSGKFKAKVAMEAIKGHRMINELSQEYGVHPNQISHWKKQLLESAADAFANGPSQEQKKLEKERDRLFRKVGQLTVENDWLKKTSDIWTDGAGKARHHRAGSPEALYPSPV